MNIDPRYVPENPLGYLFATNDGQAKSELEAIYNTVEWLNISKENIIVLRFKNMWVSFIVDSPTNRMILRNKQIELELKMLILEKMARAEGIQDIYKLY